MRRRARNAVRGQPLGDGVDAEALSELGEDPTHDCGCLLLDRQRVQSLAVGGFGRVGVRARIHELAAIRRTAAQEPSLELRLRDHRGAHPDLDPVPLAFGNPPNTDMIRSWASLSGSIGPPTSGTHNGTP
jgi:hypothetical protein